MSIIKNIVPLFTLCYLFSFSNFFYDDDDWYIIKSPNQIQSFTDDNYRIIIGTVNGIFTYDKMNGELLYDAYLSRDLPSKNIKHIYYDKNTDHIWIVHDEGVSYKPMTSFSYHHLSNSDLTEKGLSFINDIGSSSNHIWLRKSNYVISINPFTGKFSSMNDSNDEINDISWGSSMYGYAGENVNISKYYSSDPSWSIGYRVNNMNNQYIDYNVFFDEYGEQAVPTLIFKDLDNNIWIGTDSGYIFNAWRNSNKLEIIDSGVQKGIVSGAYIDEDLNWWFYDSYYKRTAQISDLSFKNHENDFLTYWNEQDGIWRKYKTNESVEIKSGDVNDIIKYDNYVLIGTMYGLLKYQLEDKGQNSNSILNSKGRWELIDVSDGLYDNAIWKIEHHNDKIFVLTSNGINEISLDPYIVVPNSFEDFRNITIFDMTIINENSEMVISTTRGLTKINLGSNIETFLSPRVCSQIEIQDFDLFCLDYGVLKGNLLQEVIEFENIVLGDNIRNFTISDHYIWINLVNRAQLKDLNNGESWYYNKNDGIQGENIYQIGNIDDWVYFISEEGVSLYNWRKFHAN